MHLISQLLEYHETVRLNINNPPGAILDYTNGDEVGLKLIAEFMVRARRNGLCSLFVPCNSTSSLFSSCNTRHKRAFNIENKLDSLVEDGCLLLCIQTEYDLDKNNFLVLKVDEFGTNIGLYVVYEHMRKPYAITNIALDYKMGIEDDLKRLSTVIMGELLSMQTRSTPSGFGSLD